MDRASLSQVTLLSCPRGVGNSLWDGAPTPPSGPHPDQHQCLPLRTLAAHRDAGLVPGMGAGTPHSLPPSAPHPSLPFITVFVLDAFSVTSGSVGEGARSLLRLSSPERWL